MEGLREILYISLADWEITLMCNADSREPSKEWKCEIELPATLNTLYHPPLPKWIDQKKVEAF